LKYNCCFGMGVHVRFISL